MDFDLNAPILARAPQEKLAVEDGVEGIDRDGGFGTKAGAKKNKWIQKIKATSTSENCSLKEAMTKAKCSTGAKKASSWIAHVKSVQAQLGCSYKDALKEASKSWKKEPVMTDQRRL